jgi:hypothetical protein
MTTLRSSRRRMRKERGWRSRACAWIHAGAPIHLQSTDALAFDTWVRMGFRPFDCFTRFFATTGTKATLDRGALLLRPRLGMGPGGGSSTPMQVTMA